MPSIILLISLLTCLANQEAKSKASIAQAAESTPSECSQPVSERDSLIREAEENQYNILWVIFVGNAHTRDYLLRRRMINLTEGDVFARENLVKSLDNVSKLKKVIYPVGLTDVKINLDRQDKVVNLDICFKEKRR